MSIIGALPVIFIVVATAGAVTFTVLYAVLAPWWRSREGQHLMALTFGLAMLGTVSIIRRIAGSEWPGYDVLVTAIYAFLALELWRRVWLLVSAQYRGHDRR